MALRAPRGAVRGDTCRLRADHLGGPGHRVGGVHPAVRGHRCAQPGVRVGDDRRGVRRLLGQRARRVGVDRAGGRHGRLLGPVGAAEPGRLRALPAARVRADHAGDRLARDGSRRRVRHPGHRGRRQRLLQDGPGPDVSRRRPGPDHGAAGDHRDQPGGDGRRAHPAALHQARQGDAGHGREPDAGPQLRDQGQPGDHHHLGADGRAVRPGRRGVRHRYRQLRPH